MAAAGPILVAYDGSAESRVALARAAELFPGRAAVIATVWEPGLAAVVPDPSGIGVPAAPVDLAAAAEVDEILSKRAAGIAAEGADLAREAGLQAAAVSTEDESKVGEVIAELAEQHDAAVVVAGSRGLSGIKARLLGSTSESILHHCRRPVLVVRGGDDKDAA
jgi:nucleotide-binding universal stress UspA family protein